MSNTTNGTATKRRTRKAKTNVQQHSRDILAVCQLIKNEWRGSIAALARESGLCNATLYKMRSAKTLYPRYSSISKVLVAMGGKVVLVAPDGLPLTD